MGIRLLLAARKSRSGDASENERYARQDNRAAERAERDGSAIVATVHDTVSSQSAPWERKNLKTWMTGAEKLAQYDGILISDVDRLARMDDEGWHYIEHWAYESGKRIVTADDVQFPPRDDSDRYQWLSLKRRARSYWEDTRDKHEDARRIVRANKAASGKPPFGYLVTGVKYGKRFDVDPVTGPIALEVFRRIADGQSAMSVAEWLAGQLGINVRAKRICGMIRNDSYLGERDGHEFATLAPNMQDLVTTARAMQDSRSVDHGGSRVVHAYSSRIYCQCGANLNHHQSTRNGKPAGQAKYRCSRGRRGIAGESRCRYESFPYDAANTAVEAAVRALKYPDAITVTSGGDVQRQARLDALAKAIDTAAAQRDYGTVTSLIAERAEVESSPAADVVRRTVLTGKSIGQKFAAADTEARRDMLLSDLFRVILTPAGVVIDWHGEAMDFLKADGTARVLASGSGE